MPGLIGKKLGMTSVFSATGKNIPCTIIEAGPCVITQVKTRERDGYEAVQLAYGEKKEKHTPKPMLGHFKSAGVTPKLKLVEFSSFSDSDLSIGKILNLSIFTEGDWLSVSGTSKGKGFQGVVKRHGFAGVGGQTHGQHNRLRAPGSLGVCDPDRVFKGKRMAGRTGGDKIKLQNLEIIKIYLDKNLILVKGSVPGAKGSFLILEN